MVRHFNPDEYEGEDGLKKLLDVLRKSPLQQLPIPDSFARLEAWHSLRHVLTQTGNSTQFWKIRLALRTLFADDEAPQQGSEKNRIWWNDDQDAWDGS